MRWLELFTSASWHCDCAAATDTGEWVKVWRHPRARVNSSDYGLGGTFYLIWCPTDVVPYPGAVLCLVRRRALLHGQREPGGIDQCYFAGLPEDVREL